MMEIPSDLSAFYILEAPGGRFQSFYANRIYFGNNFELASSAAFAVLQLRALGLCRID